jgi:hypothetical protein
LDGGPERFAPAFVVVKDCENGRGIDVATRPKLRAIVPSRHRHFLDFEPAHEGAQLEWFACLEFAVGFQKWNLERDDVRWFAQREGADAVVKARQIAELPQFKSDVVK